MISILKNYVRGSIIDRFDNEHKNLINKILYDANNSGILVEILISFELSLDDLKYREKLKNFNENEIIFNLLRDAARDWDVF